MDLLAIFQFIGIYVLEGGYLFWWREVGSELSEGRLMVVYVVHDPGLFFISRIGKDGDPGREIS